MQMQKEFLKIFEIENLEYYHFFVQSATLLLADVFENLKNTCIKIYKLNPVKFLSWISMASTFKKDKSKIRSFI